MDLGMLGLIGGVGQGISTIGAGIQKNADEAAKEERSLVMNKALLEQKDILEEAKRARIAGQVSDVAQGIAGARRDAATEDQIGKITAAYANEPLSDDQRGMLNQSIEEIRASQNAQPVEPTASDRLMAMAQVDPEKHTKDAATLLMEERKAKAAEANAALSAKELAIKEKVAQSQIEKNDAMIEKLTRAVSKGDGSDKVLFHQAIGEFKQDIGSIESKWDAARKDLVEAKKTMDQDGIKAATEAMSRLEAQAAALRKQRNQVYAAIGMPAPQDEPAAGPAAGASAGKTVAGSKYPEGTPLTGKDGKSYVVKGGVPVLVTK